MSYKDKEKRRQVAREGMRKKRHVNPHVNVNPEKLTPDAGQNVNPEKKPSTIPTYFVGGVEMVGAEGKLPERPRYLVCHDGQVYDRGNPPEADLSRLTGLQMAQLRGLNAKKFRALRPKADREELRSLAQPK